MLAFPPSELQDPNSAALYSGYSEKVHESVFRNPQKWAGNDVYGINLEETTFSSNYWSNPKSAGYLGPILSHRNNVVNWNRIIKKIDSIYASGLPIVVPAGDIGPNPQTIPSLANHSKVITVGGFNPSQAGFSLLGGENVNP